MFSLWNLLYLSPLIFVAYKAFKNNVDDYKKISSAFLVGFALTWLVSFILKSEVTSFFEVDNYIFAFIIDMFIVSLLIMFIGFKIIVGALLLGYVAMIYYAYMPYASGEILLKQYYINLEAIGIIQILFMSWGMFYGQIITSFDELLRRTTRDRINVPPYIIPDEFSYDHSTGYYVRNSSLDILGKQNNGKENILNNMGVKRQMVKHTPTYGLTAKDYWKPLGKSD